METVLGVETMIGPWKKRKTTHIRRYPVTPDGLKGRVAAVVYQAQYTVVYQAQYTGATIPGWQVFDAEGHRFAAGPETCEAGRALADAALEKK